MPCLTLLGTASIQDYVFRSNRLRENLGASGLVAHAMHWWGDAANKAKLPAEANLDVLFIGGGNAALRFPSMDCARAAIRLWSRAMLRDAPGLRLVTAHHEYEQGNLAKALGEAQKEFFRAENRCPRGIEPGALPVVRRCPSTGLAASKKAHPIATKDQLPHLTDDVEEDEIADEYEPVVWLSAEAQAKRQYFRDHARRLFSRRYSPALLHTGKRYLFPIDLGRLGTTAGASQIAIVHADGNGVGGVLANLIEDHRDSVDDVRFLKALQALSKDISRMATDSFDTLIRELVTSIPLLVEKEIVKLHHDKHGNPLLPLRPIVDEGDDLTFVCHGKLALALAARYLQLFEQKATSRGLTASAGVVIVPQKFPFAQAYALAEELSCAAKKAWRARHRQGSWIDFHLQMEGRTGDLDSFRRTQYPQWNKRTFPGRPFNVTAPEVPSWSDFLHAWETFSGWPRSQSKQYFETFSDGPDEVEALRKRLSQYKRSRLRLPSQPDQVQFDALEFLDFYFPWPAK